MPDNSSLKSSLNRLRKVLNKWRVAFLIFALAYIAILILNLANSTLQWDEVIHLNAGLNLKEGLYDKVLSGAFYPPLYDSITSFFFQAFGPSVVSARLVPVMFSGLTLWTMFELTYRMYNGKTALLASVLLGIMPGYFWLSGIALIEIMLLFFFMVSILFFFCWLQTKQNRLLVFSGLGLGLGFLTKYQIIVAGVIMIVSILFLARDWLRRAFTRFTILISTAVLVIIPWIIIAYQIYTTKIFSQWLYALQIGNPERSLYSYRYPSPIFYLIEMVWPYVDVHPISIFLYIIGFLGLGLAVWRHNKSDKFVFIWFASILVFFSLISNKEWRYVLPLFPALGISASVFILFFYGKAANIWNKRGNVNRKKAAKIAAGLFIVLIAGAMVYSINDAYSFVNRYNIKIELEPATVYAMNRMNNNESIMVLAPFNFFSQDMVNFYLWRYGNRQIQTYQYPALPVDTYTPNFNITEFINLCGQNNVKYVFTYENGGTVPYFNTTLNLMEIYTQLYNSGNFSEISDEATFGSNPRRILILTFIG